MEKHQNRDEMVLATKFTTGYRTVGAHEKIKSNFQGNHSKSLRVSVNASLKKLKTDYIDLLYVHWWDFTTSVRNFPLLERVAQSLTDLLRFLRYPS